MLRAFTKGWLNSRLQVSGIVELGNAARFDLWYVSVIARRDRASDSTMPTPDESCAKPVTSSLR
jgi:hypothetical protein